MEDPKSKGTPRPMSLKQEGELMSGEERKVWEEQLDSLTVTDLAMIAVNLGPCQDQPDQRAREALDLWAACARRIRRLRLKTG